MAQRQRPLAIWEATADGSFITSFTSDVAGLDWQISNTGDFNGDHRDDILWRNDNGSMTEWLGQANGSWVDNGASVHNVVTSDWSVAGIGDFNGDGRADVLWRKTDGEITDWLGQSNGGFIGNDSAALQPLNTGFKIVGVGDFNGDGKSDVLLEWSDGSLQVWTGSANGAILSPTENVWADAVQGASDLLNEMMAETIRDNINAAEIQAHSGGNYSSTLDMSAERSAAIGDAWYLQDPSQWSNATNSTNPTVIEVWAIDTNPNFKMVFAEGNSFGLNYLGTIDSMTLVNASSGTWDINIGGTDLSANWTDGAPPTPTSSSSSALAADAIIISGVKLDQGLYVPSGYFTLSPTASGFNFNDGFGGGIAATPQAALNTALGGMTVTKVGQHDIYTPPASKLTPNQKAASDAFIEGIKALDAANIGQLPANATLSVPETWTDSSGQPHSVTVTETAGDLSQHWANTSFALFTSGTYSALNGSGTNGSGRGSANMGADPNVSGNIVAGFDLGDTGTGVTGYFSGNGLAAMEYLALHEVAHDSFAGNTMNIDTGTKDYNNFNPGTTNYANENFANTVALATMEALGLSLGDYNPTTGHQTPTSGWQTNDIWTLNNQ